jgi:putative nucleotidyltransferase with HDIG domain
MDDLNQELKLERIVGHLAQIPTLPSIVNKLLKIVNHPKSSAADAAAFIEKDISLASKVLKLANSSYYGIPRTISNVTSAVVILGFNSIKSIILSTAVVQIFNKGKGDDFFNRKTFWKHAAEVAIIARYLAKKVHFSPLDPDMAFSAGLLHDIGKIVLDQHLHEDYAEFYKTYKLTPKPLLELEQELLGVDHSRISGMLLEHWGVPESLRVPVEFHHNPDAAGVHTSMAFIIHYSNYLSHLLGTQVIRGHGPSSYQKNTPKILGLPDPEPEFLEELRAELSSAADFFSLIQKETD